MIWSNVTLKYLEVKIGFSHPVGQIQMLYAFEFNSCVSKHFHPSIFHSCFYLFFFFLGCSGKDVILMNILFWRLQWLKKFSRHWKVLNNSTYMLIYCCDFNFISEDQTRGLQPLATASRDGDNYSLSDWNIFDENCIQLGLEAPYQKVSSSPQLSVSPKGSGPFNDGSLGPLSCCFVWVISTLWWPSVGPACCLSKVRFQSRKKPAAACVVVCLSYPKQASDSKLRLQFPKYMLTCHFVSLDWKYLSLNIDI